MEYHTRGERETEALGERLGKAVGPGTVIAYTGDLGAGKTAFTRGLARGLGYSGRVTSPTFTIVNEYEGGRLPLFHFDLYRLAAQMSCSTSAGRTTWPGAVCAPWSGASGRRTRWRTASGWRSAGARPTASGSSP